MSHSAGPPAGQGRRVALAGMVAVGLTVVVASLLFGRRGEGDVLLVVTETHGLHSGDLPVVLAWFVGMLGCGVVAIRR